MEKVLSLKQLLVDIRERKIPIFKTQKSLQYDLSVQNLPDQSAQTLKFTLKISNHTDKLITFSQTYPDISLPVLNCLYLFPQQPLIYSSENKKYAANYGGRMHFPFSSFEYDQACLFVAIADKSGGFKQIKLEKNESGIRFCALYYDLRLQAGESLTFPSVIITHKLIEGSLLQCSIALYKKLSNLWIGSFIKKQISKFQQSFLLRVIELYELEWHQSHKRVHDLKDLDLLQMLKDDEEKTGKIQFIHIRDWSAEGDGMKTKFGNYLSKQLVGNKITKEWLRNQIRNIEMSHNTQVGLYIEGYLISKDIIQSQPSLKLLLQRTQMINLQQKPYTIWGNSNLTLCNSDFQWRSLLNLTVNRVYQDLEPTAIYIDQFGFGFKTSPYKICTAQHHIHSEIGNKSEIFDLQKGELWTLKKISQSSRSRGLKVYIEQVPSDVTFPYIDGSLSSAAKVAASVIQSIPLLLTRFIYPEIKIYELITEYTMSEQQILINKPNPQSIPLLLRAIAITFWNGNGIYLPKNLNYYNKRVLQLIKELNTIFSKHKDYFWGIQAYPLFFCDIDKGVEQIVANKWINKFGKVIYTLANFGNQPQILDINGFTISMERCTLGLWAYDKYEKITSFSQ